MGLSSSLHPHSLIENSLYSSPITLTRAQMTDDQSIYSCTYTSRHLMYGFIFESWLHFEPWYLNMQIYKSSPSIIVQRTLNAFGKNLSKYLLYLEAILHIVSSYHKLFTDLDFAISFSTCCPTVHLHGKKIFCLLMFSCTCYFIQPKSHSLPCDGVKSFTGSDCVAEDPGFKLEVKSYWSF